MSLSAEIDFSFFKNFPLLVLLNIYMKSNNAEIKKPYHMYLASCDINKCKKFCLHFFYHVLYSPELAYTTVVTEKCDV